MSVMKPEDFHKSYVEAFNSGSIDLIVSHYEANAALVPQPDQVASGHPAIREAMSQFQGMGRMSAETRYVVKNGDVALASASWRITGTAPDGQPVDIQGVAIDLLRRQSDGRWLLAVDHPFGGG